VHYAYGLKDSLNVLVEGGASALAGGGPRWIGHGGVGLAYVLDVVEWVPYVGVLASGYALGGGTRPHALGAFGATLALGVDYQLSRSFALGVAARQHLLATRLAAYPSATEVLLRAELLWGW
jgi:hypothetical protein